MIIPFVITILNIFPMMLIILRCTSHPPPRHPALSTCLGRASRIGDGDGGDSDDGGDRDDGGDSDDGGGKMG